MTDKKTDDEDFALNNLDVTNDYDPLYDGQDSLNADEPLANNPYIPASEQEPAPFAAPWDDDTFTSPGLPERREPKVGTHGDSTPYNADYAETDAFDPDEELPPHADAETAVIADSSGAVMNPPVEHTTQPPDDTDEQPSGYSLPTILAIVAMLFSLAAVALNLGESHHGNALDDADSSVRIQLLEQQLSEQAQLNVQQKQSFDSQLSQLQDQITSLAHLVAALPRKQTIEQATAVTKPITPKSAPPSQWSKKTITPAPVAGNHGAWVINIVSLDSSSAAKKEQSRFMALGIKTEIAQTSIHGKAWYRLHSQGFASREQADAYKKTLAAKYGIKDAWTQKL